jgi:hypothetical protein
VDGCDLPGTAFSCQHDQLGTLRVNLTFAHATPPHAGRVGPSDVTSHSNLDITAVGGYSLGEAHIARQMAGPVVLLVLDPTALENDDIACEVTQSSNRITCGQGCVKGAYDERDVGIDAFLTVDLNGDSKVRSPQAEKNNDVSELEFHWTSPVL